MKEYIRKFFTSWQLNYPINMKTISSITMGLEIPKKIHQTHHTKEFLPEISANIQKMKKLNPNWTYRFYDDKEAEEYIKKFFPDVLATYLLINPNYGAAKADLFRYLLMYREGGVYLDIKSSFSKSLDSVIVKSDRMILSHWSSDKAHWGRHPEIDNPKGEFKQCFIIAVPGHPFLKSVIENVLRNINIYRPFVHGKGRKGVLDVTGPVAFTLALSPLLNKYPYRLVQSDKDLGFVYSLYDSLPDTHHKLSNIHYSKLEEPIIIQ